MQIYTRPDPHAVRAVLDTLRFMLVRLAAALACALGDDTAAGRWLAAWVAARLDARIWDFRNALVLLVYATRRSVRVPESRGGLRTGAGGARYVAPGFRRSRGRGSALRHATRPLMRALRQGGVQVRLARLDAALADPEPHADALARRMQVMRLFPRLTPVAPPRRKYFSDAPAAPAKAADTS